MVLIAKVFLFILVIGFIGSNVAAVWYGEDNEDRTRRAIPMLQRSTSLQLAVIAWFIWIFGARGTSFSSFGMLIAIGMSLSFVADLIMAGMIRLKNRVIGGIVAFGMVHIIYTMAGMTVASRLPGSAAVFQVLPAVILFMTLVTVVLWYFLVFNETAGRVMNYGSLGYTMLISMMVSVAITVAMTNLGMAILPFGALLFMLSDIILGNQMFQDNLIFSLLKWPYVHEAVWGTYIAGQACIVWSVWVAMNLTLPVV